MNDYKKNMLAQIGGEDKPNASPSTGGWKFENYRITKETVIILQEPLIRVNNEPLIKAGNVCLLAGKQKAGKSHAVICMLSAVLKKDNVLGFFGSGLDKNEITIYIDTEQADEQCKDNVIKIHALTQLDQLNNHYYCVAELMPEEIKDFTDKLLVQLMEVEGKKVKMLIIDGIADLLAKGNNDEEGSKKIAHWSKVIASKYNMAVIVVLHENSKGGAAGATTGHVGTYLEKKCYSYLSVAYNKDQNCHEITCKLSRQKMMSAFGVIQFRYNKETNLPELLQHIHQGELNFNSGGKTIGEQNEEQVQRIIQLQNEGKTTTEIMRIEKISQATYSRRCKEVNAIKQLKIEEITDSDDVLCERIVTLSNEGKSIDEIMDMMKLPFKHFQKLVAKSQKDFKKM